MGNERSIGYLKLNYERSSNRVMNDRLVATSARERRREEDNASVRGRKERGEMEEESSECDLRSM